MLQFCVAVTAGSLGVRLLRFRSALPQFVILTVPVPIVPTRTAPKFTEFVSKHSDGAGTDTSRLVTNGCMISAFGLGSGGAEGCNDPEVVGKILDRVVPARMMWPCGSVAMDWNSRGPTADDIGLD